ncbi:cellulose synthase subunit BcsC [Serratia rubidaea]|uniref:Cellulose synthase subunit BcsC n=1 Tax=Serratia rubidaea TaxID=61652 RepID=A0A447QMX1_SERRU|nr:cellulose synthase subunit BcsC [Serratia rubidaea]
MKKALAAAPDDPEVLGALGLAYARAGNRAQAIALFRQAQQADKSAMTAANAESD